MLCWVSWQPGPRPHADNHGKRVVSQLINLARLFKHWKWQKKASAFSSETTRSGEPGGNTPACGFFADVRSNDHPTLEVNEH
jgi:hypothetical protein